MSQLPSDAGAVGPSPAKRDPSKLSIADLNDMDLEQIRDHYVRTHFDDRGPITQALDVLDAPRNFVAGLLAPGIKARKESEGETGTFGEGKVYFSDMLKSMGVTNPIAAGVAGFVGDFAMDPLSWVGGGILKGGAKLATNVGEIGFRKALMKAVPGAVEQAAKGGIESVEHPLIKDMLKAAAVEIPEGADEAERASRYAGALKGMPKSKFNEFASRVGADLEASGGALGAVGDVGATEAAQRASAAAVAEYGKGTEPGIRIGRNKTTGKWGFEFSPTGGASELDATSTIAHIPFTGYSLNVPAFTSEGRTASTMARIAGSVLRGDSIADAIPLSKAGHLATIAASANESNKIAQTLPSILDEVKGIADEHGAEAKAATEKLRAMPDAAHLFDKDGTLKAGKDYEEAVANAPEHVAAQLGDPAHRTRVLSEYANAFTPEQSQAIAPVLDAYARSWAEGTGRPANEFYQGLNVVKGGKPGEGALYSIAGWHGSPHVFDKFDTAKIGTGEGVQAYGHGLYFSNSKDVAEWYKDQLGGHAFKVGDETITPSIRYLSGDSHTPETFARSIIANHLGSGSALKMQDNPGDWLRDLANQQKKVAAHPFTDASERTLRLATAKELEDIADRGGAFAKTGKLYNVELAPEPHELLDWDKPFAQQSQHVQEAIKSLGINNRGWDDHKGSQIYSALSEHFGYEAGDKHPEYMRGNWLSSDQNASDALHKAGIRGIKYEGRTSGETNYVIFHNDDVNIKAMFQRGEKGVPQGSYEVGQSGERIIRALSNPDASTGLHEVAHDFLTQLPLLGQDLAERAAKALGAESHAAITTAQHEQFARGFEKYLRDGKAPSSVLKEAFDKFKDWLVNLYKSIVGTPLAGKMNPQLKGIFDEMLTAGDKAAGERVAAAHAGAYEDARVNSALNTAYMKIHSDLADDAIRQAAAHTETATKAFREATQVAIHQADNGQISVGYKTFSPFEKYDEAANPRTIMAMANLTAQSQNALKRTIVEGEKWKQGLATFKGIQADENPANALARIDEHTRSLYDLAAANPEKAEAMSKIYAESMGAAKMHADLTGGILANNLHSDDMHLARATAMALGSSDAALGASVIMSMKDSMNAAGIKTDHPMMEWVDRTDRAMRTVFGQRGGAYRVPLANARDAANGARAINQRAAADVGYDLIKAMQADPNFQVPLNQRDAANDLLVAMMLQKAERVGGEESYWHTLPHSDEPSLFIKKLIDARAKGLLVNDGFRDRLDALATKYAGVFEDLRKAEQEDRLLADAVGGYGVPGVLTPEARERVRYRNANVWEEGRPGSPGNTGNETFQNTRTISQFRFNYKGKDHVLNAWQIGAAGLTDEQIAAEAAVSKNPAAVRAELETQRAAALAYKAVLDDKEVTEKPIAKFLDPFTVNQMVADGGFAHLRSGIATPQWFETSLPLLMGQRMAEHERAVQIKNLATLARQVGHELPQEAITKIMGSGQKDFINPKNGVAVNIENINLPGRNQPVPSLLIGGKRYRRIEDPFRGTIDATIPGEIASAFKDVWVPEVLADRIESILPNLKDNAPLWKAAEHVTSLWRSITLMHPSWVINSTIGHLSLALSGGVRPQDVYKFAKDAAMIRWHASNPEVLKNLSITVGGQKFSGEQWLSMLRDGRIINNDMGAMLRQRFLASPQDRLLSEQDQFPMRGLDVLKGNPVDPRNVPTAMREAFSDFQHAAEFEKTAREAGRKGGVLPPKVIASGRVLGDRMDKWVVKPFYGANTVLQDTIRSMAVASFMEQGDNAASAMKRALETVFDYHDLTRVEQHLRVLVPFYSWIRSNMAYQARLLFEMPSFAASFPKIQNAVEEMIDGEQRVPMSHRPSWMRDALAIQFGGDPETRKALMGETVFVGTDAARLVAAAMGGDGLQDLMKFGLSSTTPLITTPAQIAVGKETFSGRSIGNPGEADLGRAEFVAKQFRPYQEIAPLSRAMGQGPGSVLERATLGGKVQDFDDARLNRYSIREFTEREHTLRQAINRAERNGDKKTSQKARGNLMAMYGVMVKRGFGKNVPGWARKQLVKLQGA